MSDLYVHHHRRRIGEQEDNLVALARFLILEADAIAAAGGLSFDAPALTPAGSLDTAGPVPPLAFGPRAGIAPLSGEDWPAYYARVFDVFADDPLYAWVQSPDWRDTEPSPVGAGLRIAYALDYGTPHDYAAIAAGAHYADYDDSAFLWERIGLFIPMDFPRLRDWPEVGPGVPPLVLPPKA